MNSPPEGRFLRKRVDRGAVGYVLMIAAAQAALFLQGSAVLAAAGAALLWPLQTRTIYIAHNHHHRRTFRRAWQNLAFETLLFLQTGLPSFGFPLHHNFGHHLLYRNQNPADPDADPHVWLGRDGRRLGRWAYTWRLLGSAIPAAHRASGRNPLLWQRFRIASACYGVGLALLVAVKPLHVMAVFLVPMSLSLVALAWSTYVHHLGLLTDDPLCASYTNLSPWANRWGYNIGYHTAHHVQPGLHWSELPALHASICAGIPDHCYYDGDVAPYAKAHWPVG